MNILFVCTGNTCRSPMAEGITRALAVEKHKDVTTVSAGLFAAYSNHESRPLTMELVNAADLILGMTKDHKSVLLRQFPFEEGKIKTISEWGGLDGDVTDPYGSDQTVYNQCAEQIYHLVEAGLTSVPQKA